MVLGHNNLLIVRTFSSDSSLSNCNVVLVETIVVVFSPFQLVQIFDVVPCLFF